MGAINALHIADPPDVWSGLGFTVDAGVATVGGVAYLLGAAGKGIAGWNVPGIDGDIDGLPVAAAAADATESQSAHPNGTVALDHLVISTPDIGRTIENFEKAGFDLRRTRDAGRLQQAFFKAGDVILEIAGPPQPAGDGPARFWGLAWTVEDLDATADYLGERLHPAKDAVQKGRRIATLDKTAGSTVAHAFMSP